MLNLPGEFVTFATHVVVAKQDMEIDDSGIRP